jgi:hypothetical protein
MNKLLETLKLDTALNLSSIIWIMKDWYLSFVAEGDQNTRTFIGDPRPVTWPTYMNGFSGDKGKGSTP